MSGTQFEWPFAIIECWTMFARSIPTGATTCMNSTCTGVEWISLNKLNWIVYRSWRSPFSLYATQPSNKPNEILPSSAPNLLCLSITSRHHFLIQDCISISFSPKPKRRSFFSSRLWCRHGDKRTISNKSKTMGNYNVNWWRMIEQWQHRKLTKSGPKTKCCTTLHTKLYAYITFDRCWLMKPMRTQAHDDRIAKRRYAP